MSEKKEELPKVRLGTNCYVADDSKLIGVVRRENVKLETLQNDYSPCPFRLKDLKRLIALVDALEQYTDQEEGFEILVPLTKQGPLIIESKTTNQLYMIPPSYRPYLELESEQSRGTRS